MKCSQTAQTIRSKLNYWQDKPVSEVVPEAIVITIAQRRAQYYCKDRLRWVDAKRMALEATGCVDTAEVKKWLKLLGVRHLSLRMTSAWVAVRRDLSTKIKIARNRTASSESKVVDLADYISERSASYCAKNCSMTQQYWEQERQNNVDIVLEAMKEAITTSNWEFLRLALIDQEQYKAAAWVRLSDTEKQQILAIVPPEIRLLKKAKKEGRIAAFKECEEGGIFWVWKHDDAKPSLLSGTAVSSFFRV